MTTEQEKKWREGFNKVAPACGYILDRDQDGWYEYQSTAWAWEIYKAACQSMQAEYAENLKSLEKQMRDHIKARFEVLAKEKIKQLEAELEKAREVISFYADSDNKTQSLLDEAVELLKDFRDFGTRHDTNPTGQFMPCGCFNSFAGDNWQGFIKSQDNYVREKAGDFLQKYEGQKGDK